MGDRELERHELHLEVEGVPLVDRSVIEALAGAALSARDVPGGAVELGVQWVGAARIRELNRVHRGVDAATDVLSFPIDGVEDLGEGIPRQLGDIVVCAQFVVSQVADGTVMVEPDQSMGGDEQVEQALRRCVAHGLLHLLGEHHDDDAAAARMFALEEQVLAAAGGDGS